MSVNTPSEQPDITAETIQQAEKLADLAFTDSERALMLDGVRERVAAYQQLREVELPNIVPPAISFDPQPLSVTRQAGSEPDHWLELPAPELPADLEEVAF